MVRAIQVIELLVQLYNHSVCEDALYALRKGFKVEYCCVENVANVLNATSACMAKFFLTLKRLQVGHRFRSYYLHRFVCSILTNYVQN